MLKALGISLASLALAWVAPAAAGTIGSGRKPAIMFKCDAEHAAACQKICTDMSGTWNSDKIQCVAIRRVDAPKIDPKQ